MDGLDSPSRRRPTTRREREVRAGPRTTLTIAWVALDLLLIVAAAFVAYRRFGEGRVVLATIVAASAVALFAVDVWRVARLAVVRRLAALGRIDRAEVTSVELARFSVAPRADGPAPTGGWPFVRAAEVAYAFDDADGVRRRGRFLVGADEAPQFPVGEDVEVFVDRDAPGRHAPSLVVRWYFRLSSRHVGLSDDDPGIAFEFTTFEDEATKPPAP